MRRAWDVSRWDGASYEDVYRSSSMGVTERELDCEVVERVKCCTLRRLVRCANHNAMEVIIRGIPGLNGIKRVDQYWKD